MISATQFPLYLAPMAGVTDNVFRQLCKELGADVMTTEFVSAEGIIRCDERTRKYTEFTDEQRPVGVQIFGADGKRMGEAARKIIDWKEPDFIDINFGCPVNKVVSKNGGSSLLKNCPLLENVAYEIRRAVDKQIPVTAKIRIGWDLTSINAVEVCRRLEGVGIAAIAVHGRTRSQGYSGEANWEVIDECSRSVQIPVIGNGDITSYQQVVNYRAKTNVTGIMIGRGAMHNPWLFQEMKQQATGQAVTPVTLLQKWQLITRHCKLALASSRYGNEVQTITAMRGRLMNYTKGFAGAKQLRAFLSQCQYLEQIQQLQELYLSAYQQHGSRHVTENAFRQELIKKIPSIHPTK